jgi:hypothetical protein
MTAEIALLNKLAVTLAADSAVTIGSGDATKVYNSADKIFEATNYDPIGIMVYNSPELNGVPVESIVKMHRDRVCNRHFPNVFEFATAFLGYVEKLETPDITIKRNVQALASGKLFELRGLLRSATDEFFRSISAGEREVAPDQMAEELDKEHLIFVDVELAMLVDLPTPAWAGDLSDGDVTSAHGDAIQEVIEWAFDEIYLSDTVSERISRIASLTILKEYQRDKLTGLVFAGFGEDEIFPSLVSYEVYGLIAGKLKHARTNQFDVDRKLEPDAAVIPFAQQEMVDRFMYGLDTEFLNLCGVYFAGALTDLKIRLADLITDADQSVKDAIPPAIDTILDEFNGSVVPDHLTRSRTQLSDMVRSMPKQELAALSESLVHITSLKRKFSAGAESVGGPIDVAMITRAEGFVWVKRKHYFDPGLNPRYFSRRYGNGSGQNQPGGLPVQLEGKQE